MSTHDLAPSAWHGTLRDYITGFLLSAILTALAFWLVMGDVLEDDRATALVIMVFAAVQVIVQVVFFLHVSARSESGWTMVSLLFTLIIVVITLAGSLWIMHHLNHNMMPDARDQCAFLSPGRLMVLAVVALVGFAGLTGLGAWQLRRLAWKRELDRTS